MARGHAKTWALSRLRLFATQSDRIRDLGVAVVEVAQNCTGMVAECGHELVLRRKPGAVLFFRRFSNAL